MCDVFDEIINKLPPSTVRMILDFNNDHLNRAANFNNILHDIEKIKIKQVNQVLKRKTFDIKSKTAENRNYLAKLKKELQALNLLQKTPGKEQVINAYNGKINELESKVLSLVKDEGDVDLNQLFNDIEKLNQEIDDYKKKISEARSKYQYYDNFPPDIEQGKEIIAKIREKIKKQESFVESFFHS